MDAFTVYDPFTGATGPDDQTFPGGFFFFDPDRESEEHALPDGEVFYVSPLIARYNRENADHGDDGTIYTDGWYWWACFPGCMPEGDGIATGPFTTPGEALLDAREER